MWLLATVSTMQIEGVVDCEVTSAPNHPWYEWEGGRGTSPDDWLLHPELLVDSELRFSFGGYLIRGGPLGDRVVLVDCGNGPYGDEFIPAGHMLTELRSKGVEVDDVTDILLTHLHYDHTGWLSVDNRPVFPNAEIHVAEADVAHFTDPGTKGLSGELTPQRLRSVESHLRPFTGRTTLAPGITAVPAPGHTPGSTVFVASSGTSRVVFLGDVVHCPVQLVDTEWAVLGDIDPALALRTRRSVEAEFEGAELAGAHFPGLSLGRVIRTEVPPRWSLS
jgi:glyoxylase-like metal-dependent hydrolase (beta-lactamase superfamily II)